MGVCVKLNCQTHLTAVASWQVPKDTAAPAAQKAQKKQKKVEPEEAAELIDDELLGARPRPMPVCP